MALTLYEPKYSKTRETVSLNDHAKNIKIYEKFGRPFSEVRLGRVWQHAQENGGFIMASAFRDERTELENLRLHDKLKELVRSYDLGYFVLDGKYIENEGTPDEVEVSELSLFIPYRDSYSPAEFEQLGKRIIKTFKQDAVLLKTPYEPVKELNKSGKTYELGQIKMDAVAQIYSSLRKGPHKNRSFTFEGVEYPSNSFGARVFTRENQLW